MRSGDASRGAAAQFAFEMSLFSRDRLSVFWALLFPVLLIVILGFAFGGSAPASATGQRGNTYVESLVAGVIGMNLMGMALFNIGTSLLQYRERGVFARLLVGGTPLGGAFAGLVLNRYVVVAIQLFLMIATAHAVLGLHLSVTNPAFALALASGIACFTLLGLTFALLVRTSTAAMALGNALYLPLAFLSGAYFNVDRLPGSALLHILPSSAEIDMLRLSIHGTLASLVTAPSFIGVILWTITFGVIAFFLRGRLLTEGR